MDACIRNVACPVREQLLAQFKRCNDHYNQTLCSLLGTMSVKGATWLVADLYTESTEARKALEQHEREHGCYDNADR
jgi:hypothetical protein